MKKKYLEFFYLLILGCITSFGLPHYNFTLVCFLTLSLLFVFIIRKKINFSNKKVFFSYGWFFGFGYFISSLYWVSISLTFDQNFNFLIPFALILIPSFLAIFYGTATYVFSFFNLKNEISYFFLLSLLFGCAEFLRGILFTGFPWNLFAFSFSKNLEIINLVSYIGTYSFNLICLSILASSAVFIIKKNKKNFLISLILLITPLLFYHFGSLKIKKFNLIEKKENNFTIRAIGSNISMNRFYDISNQSNVLEELIFLSKPNKDKKIIFIWPEGIVPGLSKEEIIKYKNLFIENFNNNHLIGLGLNSTSFVEGKEKIFNSFALYDHRLNLIYLYNKLNLVPFGEFLPFEKVLNKFGLKTITNNYRSYSKGKVRNLIEIKNKSFALKLLPLICYEIIYSGKIFDDSNFDYIINISEDGWFGQSVGPKQHFVHSIFRAVESGKYVIRSANNGKTAIVNPMGIIEKRITYGESGYIDFEESRIVDPTLFSKYGNKIFLLIILLYIFIIISFNKIRND